jgi:hypothetical protein
MAVGTYNNANNTSESTEVVVYEIKQVNRIGNGKCNAHHCSPPMQPIVVSVAIDTIDYVPEIGNGAESENNPCYHADSAMLLFVHCCY